VIFTKISCVSSDLVELRGVNHWFGLELEYHDAVSGDEHHIRAPPALERKLKFKDDIPILDVQSREGADQCVMFATPRV
jgi:hypothetical protein